MEKREGSEAENAQTPLAGVPTISAEQRTREWLRSSETQKGIDQRGEQGSDKERGENVQCAQEGETGGEAPQRALVGRSEGETKRRGRRTNAERLTLQRKNSNSSVHSFGSWLTKRTRSDAEDSEEDKEKTIQDPKKQKKRQ